MEAPFDFDKLDLDWVASKSLRNCHAMGIDSLVFSEAPMIRAFVCRPEHELWLNDPEAGLPFSVGLHPHHCEVTLVPIFGNAYNVVHVEGRNNEIWNAFEYKSPITGGTAGSFTRLGYGRGFHLVKELIDRPACMRAREIHTIYVPQGNGAAWYVLEGADNPNFRPITYSNHNLEGMDFSGMYQPMTVAEVEQIVNKIKALGPVIEMAARQ